MNLLSWLDIERVLVLKTQNFANLPTGISSIRAYGDALEINTIDNNETTASEFLREAFGVVG